MASTALGPERLARADFARFLAALYYEPGPEIAEERVFESLALAAELAAPTLAEGVARLAQAFALASIDELRIDYTRLFLGASSEYTRPYASSWLGGTSADALDLYAEAGIDVDLEFADLPDHVAVELEFLYRLLLAPGAPGLRRRFVVEHLARWLPPFLEAVEKGAGTAFYAELACLTRAFLVEEMQRAG